VEELDRTLSHFELIEWMAIERIEPFGEVWHAWQTGLIVSTLINVNAGKKGKMLKPEDVIHIFKQQRKADGDQMQKGLGLMSAMRDLAGRA
jgi:uncharacterized protein DUF4035